jgi:membrane protein
MKSDSKVLLEGIRERANALFAVLRKFRSGNWEGLTRSQIRALRPPFIALLAGRELIRDRGTDLAGSLTFTTALSIVPLLSVASGLLASFGLFESSQLVTQLEGVFPTVAGDVAEYLRIFSESSTKEIGGLGGLALLFIAIYLFVSIERAFNRIWSSKDVRPWIPKILTFHALITLGPILVALSIAHTARLQYLIEGMGFNVEVWQQFLPAIYSMLLFGLMNRTLPSGKVRWYAALTGGIVTGLAFELAKWGFNLYVNAIILEAYNKIYGALGIIPIFLIWVYLSWIIVLFGAEVAFVTQNLRRVLRKEGLMMLHADSSFAPSPVKVIDVFAHISRSFHEGSGGIDTESLQEATGIQRQWIERMITSWSDGGLVVTAKVGNKRLVLPARPPHSIRLEEVVDRNLFFHVGTSELSERLQREYETFVRRVLSSRTADDLYDADSDAEEEVPRPPEIIDANHVPSPPDRPADELS